MRAISRHTFISCLINSVGKSYPFNHCSIHAYSITMSHFSPLPPISPVTKFKPSANLSFLWPDVGFGFGSHIEKYRLASKFGFAFIESMFPPPDVTLEMMKEAQTRYGLSQMLINTEAGDNYGYAAVKDFYNENIACSLLHGCLGLLFNNRIVRRLPGTKDG
uniref:Hydroxypyruvate isomerase n=1 Tax=Cacopsylla melanoneura TaxID=428564 RepID=A0A8D9BNH3_9HEMI